MTTPGFYFCICPDALLAKQHMEALCLELDLAAKKPEYKTFWPEDLEENAFWNTLDFPSFGDSYKVLYIRQAHTINAATWKRLSYSLATPRSHAFPVFFFEGPWEKGKAKIPAYVSKLKCFEFAVKQKWEFRSIGLNERNIQSFLSKEAKKYNLIFSPKISEILSHSVYPDAYSIQMLVSQLALIVQEGEITEQDLAQLTAYAPELLIFDLIKYIQKNDAKAVWQTLAKEQDGGSDILFALISLMTREARLLWQLKSGERPDMSPSLLSIKQSFAVKLGYTNITKLFDLLAHAEYDIKSGKKSEIQVFESLIAELCSLFNPK